MQPQLLWGTNNLTPLDPTQRRRIERLYWRVQFVHAADCKPPIDIGLLASDFTS